MLRKKVEALPSSKRSLAITRVEKVYSRAETDYMACLVCYYSILSVVDCPICKQLKSRLPSDFVLGQNECNTINTSPPIAFALRPM